MRSDFSVNNTWYCTCYGDKQVEDEWDIIRQSAETPGIRTDWFFLYILSNILRRPVVMHGQVCVSDDEQLVPALKIEMRG